MNVRWVALFLLAACGPSRGYQARTILREGDLDARAMRTLGCVDVAFGLRFVGGDVPMLLRTRFGNRCLEPVAFDLSRVRIVGHYTQEGQERTRTLSLSDPRAEVVPLHLDALTEGLEKIRVLDPAPAHGELRAICVHLDELVPSARDAHAAPVCFAAPQGAAAEWEVRS